MAARQEAPKHQRLSWRRQGGPKNPFEVSYVSPVDITEVDIDPEALKIAQLARRRTFPVWVRGMDESDQGVLYKMYNPLVGRGIRIRRQGDRNSGSIPDRNLEILFDAAMLNAES